MAVNLHRLIAAKFLDSLIYRILPTLPLSPDARRLDLVRRNLMAVREAGVRRILTADKL